MATGPSAPPMEPSKPVPAQGIPMEPSKPVPGQGSAPPFEMSKPVPGQDPEAGVRGRGLQNDRLPCCGLGIGWVLFILGFIFGAIPWYAGALLLCFYRRDYREKPGFIACTVAAVIGTIIVIIAAVIPTEVHRY